MEKVKNSKLDGSQQKIIAIQGNDCDDIDNNQ